MRKKIFMLSTLVAITTPVVTVVACGDDNGYKHLNLDLSNGDGKEAKSDLEKSASWSKINSINYSVKGSVKVGEIVSVFEGLDEQNVSQKVKFTAKIDSFSKDYSNLTAQINNDPIINDVFSKLDSNQILEDTYKFYIAPEAADLLDFNYEKPVIEFVEANKDPASDLIGSGWAKKNYNQTKIIFKKDSTVLSEILNANNVTTSIDNITTNLDEIEKKIIERLSYNDEQKKNLDFGIYPSVMNGTSDHIELNINNLALADAKHIFEYSTTGTWNDKSLIIYHLINAGLNELHI